MSPCSSVVKPGKEKAVGHALGNSGVEARSSLDWKMTDLCLFGFRSRQGRTAGNWPSVADGSSLEGPVGAVRSPAALLCSAQMLPKLPENCSWAGRWGGRTCAGSVLSVLHPDGRYSTGLVPEYYILEDPI